MKRFALLLLPLSMPLQATEEPILSTTVNCRANPTCAFTGNDLPIDIVIENISTQEVGYPEEYARRRGPYVRLIDNVTKRERPLRVGLANGQLKRQFTPLSPGRSVTISTVIKQSAILGFGADRVDLQAKIAVPAEIQVGSRMEPVTTRASGTLHIVGAGAGKP